MSKRHTELKPVPATTPDSDFVAHTRTLLKTLGITRSREITSVIDIHDMVLKGIPRRSLKRLQTATGLSPRALARAIPINLRSYHRLASEFPAKKLTAAISSNVWQLADIYIHAINVMGTKTIATQWLNSETLALNGRKPIDLLSTRQGADLVSDLLTRLDYGVYT